MEKFMDQESGRMMVTITEEEFTRLQQEARLSLTQHIQLNQRYHIQFDRAASANKTDGFKVEANGDDFDKTYSEATQKYAAAIIETEKNRLDQKPAITGQPLKEIKVDPAPATVKKEG